MKKKVVAAGFALVFAALSFMSLASELPKPEGPIILTVSGNITHTNTNSKAHFDRQMLEQLPQASITTQTPWTEEAHVYEGVLLRVLLEYVGAEGQKLRAEALNDYHTEIDLSTLQEYPILLALKSDGKYMRIRDKGPIWVILPLSDYSELNISEYHETMIWQLRSLEVD